MAQKINLDPFMGVYGLPPSTWLSDDMIVNSMPVFDIIPAKPEFSEGLNLFRVEDDSERYLKILATHGYTTAIPIRVAFLADNFPTDSFTNDYGETFLQKFTDVASQGMSQLAQMTGSQTGTEALRNIGGSLSDLGEDMGGMMGGALSGVGGAASGAGSGIEKLLRRMESNDAGGVTNVMGGGVQLINKMVAGHRVDFPQVWRNSGFSPSYTATVRLYNPNPSSDKATEQYIIGPLAVLLALALPTSDDGKTYNWPFFHKIKSPGIYGLDPAVITNMTVVKGGDQQQIAYNQRLGMVDVRIDFTSLYNTLLAEEGTGNITNRPTLKSYLKAMKDIDPSLSRNRQVMRAGIGPRAGVQPGGTRFSSRTGSEDSSSVARRNLIAKNEAARQRQAPKITEVLARTRVPVAITNQQRTLVIDSDRTFIEINPDVIV